MISSTRRSILSSRIEGARPAPKRQQTLVSRASSVRGGWLASSTCTGRVGLAPLGGSSLAEHVLLQPGVAERTAGIEPLEQADEVGPALIERSDRGGIGQEDLAPVRARLEGGESRLEVE